MTDTTETTSPGRFARRFSTSEHAKTVPRPKVSWGVLLLVFVGTYVSRAVIGRVEWSIRSFAYSAMLFMVFGAAIECRAVVWAWWNNRRR